MSINICHRYHQYIHVQKRIISFHRKFWNCSSVQFQLLVSIFLLYLILPGYCFDENSVYALDEYADADPQGKQVAIKRQTKNIDACDSYAHGEIKGYRLTPTSRFILFDAMFDWNSARTTCEEKKMQFATIKDDNVNYHVYQSLSTLNGKHFGGKLAGVWIGGHDRDVDEGGVFKGEGYFRWVNPINKPEDPIEYENFELGNPNNYGTTFGDGVRSEFSEEDCVEVYMRNYRKELPLDNLFWNDRGCHGRTRFLCEYQPNQPDQCAEKSDAKSTPPAPANETSNGPSADTETSNEPRRIGQTRFHVIGQQLNWEAAQETCARHGLMGAAITDESNQELLEYAITMMMINKKYPKYVYDGRRFWTSGVFMDRKINNKSFTGQENQFKGYDGKLIWTSTDSIVGNWKKWYDNKNFYKDGQPEPRDDSYGGLENCIDMHIIKKNGKANLYWYASACHLTASFLCMDVTACALNNNTLLKRQIKTNYMEYGFLTNGKQFHAMGDPNRQVTWIEANVNCNDMGLQLATPADFIQSRILVEKMAKKIHHGTLGHFWLGYFGGPSSEFTHLGTNELGCLSWNLGKLPWEKQQPNVTDNGELLCVKMDFRRRGMNGMWSIGNCYTEKHFYLCEEKCSKTKENEAPDETKRSILKFKHDIFEDNA